MRALLRGAWRFGIVAAIVIGVAGFAGAFFALLAHVDVRRGISVAFYAVGALITVVGVLHGLRPPVRVDREQGRMGLFGMVLTGGQVRKATVEERDEALASSGLFVALGVVLLVLGGLIDPVHRLV
ncbi:MAG: hypothetical protein ACTHNU_17170 [Gaiellales bacterium]